MSFLCPISGSAEVAWHDYVHLGLTAGVVVGGAVFLVAAIWAFLRSNADRRETSRYTVGERRC